MLFILLFTLGILAIPLIMDHDKHGRNNILVRSAHEAMTVPKVAALVETIRDLRMSVFSGVGYVLKAVAIVCGVCIALSVVVFSYDFNWTVLLVVAAVLVVGVVRINM
ncbi:hypothetical protein [Pseudomonas sp. NA-150]|uniref:hypothetical protein n=1 Tax=Pseudomonas sp. NA-150 TaxID=3367525 RepID=UPI0037CC9CC3